MRVSCASCTRLIFEQRTKALLPIPPIFTCTNTPIYHNTTHTHTHVDPVAREINSFHNELNCMAHALMSFVQPKMKCKILLLACKYNNTLCRASNIRHANPHSSIGTNAPRHIYIWIVLRRIEFWKGGTVPHHTTFTINAKWLDHIKVESRYTNRLNVYTMRMLSVSYSMAARRHS